MLSGSYWVQVEEVESCGVEVVVHHGQVVYAVDGVGPVNFIKELVKTALSSLEEFFAFSKGKLSGRGVAIRAVVVVLLDNSGRVNEGRGCISLALGSVSHEQEHNKQRYDFHLF